MALFLSKKMMGSKTLFLCLSLLLLMVLQLESQTCCAEEIGKNSRFKVNGDSAKMHSSFRGRNSEASDDRDKIFRADQRKVTKGPNPLHNR